MSTTLPLRLLPRSELPELSSQADARPTGWDTCLCIGFAEASLVRFRSAAELGLPTVSQLPGILELLHYLYQHTPRFVVVELPDASVPWLLALSSIRAIYRGPLIVLGDEEDAAGRLLALKLGADKFLPRSVSALVLWAHLRADERSRILSRAAKSRLSVPGSAEEASDTDAGMSLPHLVERNGWVLEAPQCKLTAPNGRSLKLTRNERTLLALLIQDAPEPVRRARISRALRGRDRHPTSRSLDVIVCRVRGKLRAIGAGNAIASLRGWGYQFVDVPDA